jgi:SAM-dependent methyltransferase
MPESEYVLGASEAEIARLGLQHRAWRTRAMEVWRWAGIKPGHTVIDVGCGPGYASKDLAEMVGPHGRVVAIDKSARFLDVLRGGAAARTGGELLTHCVDLEAGEFPEVNADRVWCRWVLSFVKNPNEVLARMAAALRPGGAIVMHEYFDYSTWRTMPPCPEVDRFVSAVMTSWRASGGEPDIALGLPRGLERLGMELARVRPMVEVTQPGEALWAWLREFIRLGRQRLVELGFVSAAEAESIWREFARWEAEPGARMVTPAVLEIVALRRG